MPSNDNSFDWAAYNKRINEKNSHYDYTYVTGRKYETSYKSYLMDNSNIWYSLFAVIHKVRLV